MGCRLYRAGKTHEVRGVMCEAQKFESHEVHIQLQNGWFTTPQAAYEVEEDLQEETEAGSEINYDLISTPDLRVIAKEACIDNWKKARRSTLLNKLKEV